MKKLISFTVICLIMLLGCTKDLMNDENAVLKKANIPIPLKGYMCMGDDNTNRIPVANTPVVDPSTGKVLIPKLTLAGLAHLSGHATHLGIFDTDNSYMTGSDAYLDLVALFTEHKIIVKAKYLLVITGAQGDCVRGTSNIAIDRTAPGNGIITADWSLTGGTGRFENVSGEGIMSGIVPCWDIEGTLEYPDK